MFCLKKIEVLFVHYNNYHWANQSQNRNVRRERVIQKKQIEKFLPQPENMPKTERGR
jgi:hypothetical protein